MTAPTSGLTGSAHLVVTSEDTAIALRSGDVPVLATPRMIALAEEAACAALAGSLTDDTTSVGTRVDVEHVRASRIGAEVRAQAVLESVEDRTLHFSVTVTEGDRVVAAGRVTRVIVERSRFA